MNDNWYLLESEMVNEENDCHSHICEPLFSNHSKTMMLKTKVDIHVFSTIEFFFDMLSLENIISDIEPNVSNKQEKNGVNPYIGYDFV